MPTKCGFQGSGFSTTEQSVKGLTWCWKTITDTSPIHLLLLWSSPGLGDGAGDGAGKKQKVLTETGIKVFWLLLDQSDIWSQFFLSWTVLEYLFSYPITADFLSSEWMHCILEVVYSPPLVPKKAVSTSSLPMMKPVHLSNWLDSIWVNLRWPNASSFVHIWLCISQGNTHTCLA